MGMAIMTLNAVQFSCFLMGTVVRTRCLMYCANTMLEMCRHVLISGGAKKECARGRGEGSHYTVNAYASESALPKDTGSMMTERMQCLQS